MPFDVFISYSSVDKLTADAACNVLESTGVRCWIAPRDIAPGAAWTASIVKAIGECRVVVLIFSSNANKSDQVRKEVDLAFSKSIPVVPLRIENVPLADALAFHLNSVHWLDALTPPLEVHLERLANSVSALLHPQGDGPRSPVPSPTQSSRRGIGALQADDERKTQQPLTETALPQGDEAQRGIESHDVRVSAAPAKEHKERKRGQLSRRLVLIGGGLLAAGSLAVVAQRQWGGRVSSQVSPVPIRDTSIRTFVGYDGEVDCVAFAPDGRTALSGGDNKSLKLWDLSSASATGTFYGHTLSIISVGFTPDGRTALTGSFDQTLRLWDVANRSLIRTFAAGASVFGTAITPDGRRAISGGEDRNLKLWDLASGSMIRSVGAQMAAGALAIAKDGRTALLGDSGDASVYKVGLWNLANLTLIRMLLGHESWISSVAFSPDGRTGFSAGADNTIKSWNLADGTVVNTFYGHRSVVKSIAVSGDGRTLLSGSGDRTLRLWDVQNAIPLHAFEGHTDAVNAVAIAPDGHTALSASSDKTLKLWSLS